MQTSSDSTLTGRMAEFVAASRYEDLPADVADRIKMIVFDELACAVVGRGLIAGDLISQYVGQMGGVGEATVFGSNYRAPAALAALANGTAGHADEFDGAHVCDGHPGAVIVNAVAAVGEARRVSGDTLMAAISVGYDIGTRLVVANGGAFTLRQRHSIHSDHLLGFGAAVACARVLGLGADGIRHAAALAAGHAGGLAVVFEERRHMSKALSIGQAAFAGASAAQLAALGFEGHDNVLDSKLGPLSWNDAGPAAAVLSGLGSEHTVMGHNFKFYSAGYPIHSPVEAALNIIGREKLDLADIAQVIIGLNTRMADVVSDRDMPTICAQEMVALAMVYGHLGFDLSHSSSALANPEVRRLRALTEVVADPEQDRIQPKGRGTKVVIKTRQGDTHEESIAHPRGHSQRGHTQWPELFEKWDEMLTARLGAERYRTFQLLCQNLQNVSDFREVTALLSC